METPGSDRPLDLAEITKVLKDDPAVRAGVIRVLARDFPKDFLSPVKVDFEKVGRGGTASCKEWQE